MAGGDVVPLLAAITRRDHALRHMRSTLSCEPESPREGRATGRLPNRREQMPPAAPRLERNREITGLGFESPEQIAAAAGAAAGTSRGERIGIVARSRLCPLNLVRPCQASPSARCSGLEEAHDAPAAAPARSVPRGSIEDHSVPVAEEISEIQTAHGVKPDTRCGWTACARPVPEQPIRNYRRAFGMPPFTCIFRPRLTEAEVCLIRPADQPFSRTSRNFHATRSIF